MTTWSGAGRRLVLGAALAAGEALLSALLWRRLPERVAVHWDLSGGANGFAPRLQAVLLGPSMLLGLGILLAVLYRTDPRRRSAPPADAPPREASGTRWMVEVIVLGLVASLNALTILAAAGFVRDVGRALAIFLALMLLLLGNVIGRVRPSWFVGIRTPWTLSSDAVWRRTHRAAARAMFTAGVIALPCALWLPQHAAQGVVLGLVLASTLGPAIASWFWWLRESGTP